MNEDVSPIKNGDFPVCDVSFQGGYVKNLRGAYRTSHAMNHQKFQVAKMEGFLNLIRLFWRVSLYISLTYSLYR